MTRSKSKLPYIHPKLLEKVQKIRRAAAEDGENKSSFQNPIKTWSRGSTIIELMVGMTIQVHNGKDFIPVRIDPARVGHKLGEFSPTRKFGGHPEKKKEDTRKGKTGAK